MNFQGEMIHFFPSKTRLWEAKMLNEDNGKSIVMSMSSKYCELDSFPVLLLKIVLKFLYQL